MSDESEAVIVEILEAVSAALDEFHLAMKSFSDAFVFCGSPHAGDRTVSPEAKQAFSRRPSAWRREFGDP